MDKKITKRFKDKVFKRALEDANHLLDVKGERLKTYTQLLLWGFLLAFIGMLVFFGWRNSGEAFNYVLGALIGNIILLGFFYFYPRVLAGFNMWKSAAQLHNEMGGFDVPNIEIDVCPHTLLPGRCWVSLIIRNESKYSLQGCFVKIISIKPTIITYAPEEIILEWTENFRGNEKIEIGVRDGNTPFQAFATVACSMGNVAERKVISFASEEYSKDPKYVGKPQKYVITLELNGLYLWQTFKETVIVEIDPHLDSNIIDIRKIPA